MLDSAHDEKRYQKGMAEAETPKGKSSRANSLSSSRSSGISSTTASSNSSIHVNSPSSPLTEPAHNSNAVAEEGVLTEKTCQADQADDKQGCTCITQ